MADGNTDLRRAFFEEVYRDPYVHMQTKIWVSAWADGFEACRKLVSKEEDILDYDHSDIEHLAAEQLTRDKRRAEVNMLIAMASMSKSSLRECPPKL